MRPCARWPQEVTSTITRSTAKDAYVVDDIALPLDNPWRRNVRLSDIQFLDDGTGVGVTLDGDVWLIRGLHDPGGVVRWRRFASGLHEPLTLAIRDEQIYVFDRNGIWRLRDTNGDGEADVHELFSNAFAQTADMREFPSTLRLAPGGEFVIAKGGQEATTLGKHNGSVLRISADGRRATVLGYGFRQPNIGVNLRTGLVTASDQQGNYIPSTPLHIVRDRAVLRVPQRQAAARSVPRADRRSAHVDSARGQRVGDVAGVAVRRTHGAAQRRARAHRLQQPGALSRAAQQSRCETAGRGREHHARVRVSAAQRLGESRRRPALSRGLPDPRLGDDRDAARRPGPRALHRAPVSTLPREVVPMDKGVLLRFDAALDPARAADPDNYSLASWHYKRTYQYGSPQFKADGTPGIDRLTPSSAYLSKDGRSVFVGVPGMKPVMQMRVGWSLATADGATFQETAYFTPYELPAFDPRAEGFGDLTVDLSPRAAAVNAVRAGQRRGRPSLVPGLRLHRVPRGRQHVAHQARSDLERPLRQSAHRSPAASSAVIADEAYLRESILQPAAKVVSGYERGEVSMPSYAGVLTDSQVDSLVLFIKSLEVAR